MKGAHRSRVGRSYNRQSSIDYEHLHFERDPDLNQDVDMEIQRISPSPNQERRRHIR